MTDSVSAEYIRMLHPLDLEPADIAAHIDAQDAKIKALVEALADEMAIVEQAGRTDVYDRMFAALAAAKETT